MTGSASKHILVVEDDPDILTGLVLVLETEGYTVTSVSDGAGALALLRKGTEYAVILFDLLMPVMDGWEFRAEQIHDSALAKIPAVAMSAQGKRAQLRMPIEVDGYLEKPIKVDALLETIGRLAK